MYRIRSSAGIETVYSSLEEFVGAVRRGSVAHDDEIFHSRADKWLDVKSHPHFRLATNGQDGHAPAPVVPSVPTPPRQAAGIQATQVVARPRLRADVPVSAAPSAAGLDFSIISDGLDSPMRGSSSLLVSPEETAPYESHPANHAITMPRVVAPRPRPRAPEVVLVEAPAPVAAPSVAPRERPAPEAKAASAPPVAASSPTVPSAPTPPHSEPIVVAEHPPEPNESSEPARAGSGRMFLGVGTAVVVLAVGALLAWHPWSGNLSAEMAAQTAQPAELPEQATAPAPDPSLQQFVASVTAAAAAQPVAPPEPVVEKPKVLAAVRPNLTLDLSVPTAEIDLGSPAAAPATVVGPSELARRVNRAEAQARGALERELGDFRDMLGFARLASAGSLSATRSVWVSAGDAIRRYRATVARLEQTYNDSLLIAQQARKWPAAELQAWSARPDYAEPGELSQVSDLMFAQIAQALDVLSASAGAYQVRNGRVHFASATDAVRYSSIQTWVSQRMQSWASSPAGTRAYTVNLVLRALGEGLPPIE